MDNKSIEAFMFENAAKIEDVEFIVSNRFKDENGKPKKWLLHAISGVKDNAIRNECIQNGKFNKETYLSKLTAATVKYPNLGLQALQDSYHAMGNTDLLEKMLTGGELTNLLLKAQEVNGYIKDINTLIKEVKNG